MKAWQVIFFLRISQMNQEFPNQNKAFERQTRHMAHGRGGYSSFGNNAVTFSRSPQRLRKLIADYRSPNH
jgi:hypothetical protein